MASKGGGSFGYGAHAGTPCRFTTIEQKVSGARVWYDRQLKDSTTANPFRSQRLLDVMGNLENTMGRSVVHRASVITEPPGNHNTTKSTLSASAPPHTTLAG